MVEEVTFGEADESRVQSLPGPHASAVSGDEVEINDRVDMSILSHDSDLTPSNTFHYEGDSLSLAEAETASADPPAGLPPTADPTKSTQHVPSSSPQSLPQGSK